MQLQIHFVAFRSDFILMKNYVLVYEPLNSSQQFLASQYEGQRDHRKTMLADEYKNATRLTTFLNFEGYLKYSPLFYGQMNLYFYWFTRINILHLISFERSPTLFTSFSFVCSYYSDYSGIAKQGYNLPLAYFFAGVAVYIYSFWATLRK